jgi:hypothetical protein
VEDDTEGEPIVNPVGVAVTLVTLAMVAPLMISVRWLKSKT